MLDKLQDFEDRSDYPFDAVFLHGAVSDNQPLDARLAEVVKQWNERYEYPKIIFSPNAEFFEYIEKHYGDKLPVYRGSAGTYWEDGAGSSARETALSRNAHEAAGQRREVPGPGRPHRRRPGSYRPDEINHAWRNCLLYDEHTWGAYCSISQPDSDFTKAQWKIKAQFAVDAAQQAKAILDRGSKALAVAGADRRAGAGRLQSHKLAADRRAAVKLPEGHGRGRPGCRLRMRRRRARCCWSRTSRRAATAC